MLGKRLILRPSLSMEKHKTYRKLGEFARAP